MHLNRNIMYKTKILSTVHNLLGCHVFLFQNWSVAIGVLSKKLEVRQKEIVKLMVQLKPINFSGSTIRAQNIVPRLGQESTRCAPASNERLPLSLWLWHPNLRLEQGFVNRCLTGDPSWRLRSTLLVRIHIVWSSPYSHENWGMAILLTKKGDT